MEKKFIDVIDTNEWEIETDSGWQPMSRIGKTVPYFIWEIKTKSFFLECADFHIVFLENLKEIYVKDLKPGDILFTENGPEELISVYNTGIEKNMYDIEIDNDDHRYFTSGILSHNTLWLGNLGAQAVKTGNNVAILSLEMTDRKYVKRVGANILGIPISEYSDSSNDDQLIKRKLSSVTYDNLKVPGHLLIKEFPTSQASVNDIERYLRKVEEMRGIKFKVIIVDYINIMKNWRNPNSENTYMKIKQIAEDLRGMAMTNNWSIITATQTKQCLTLDTKIESRERGLIEIGDCNINDEILCEQGWTKILHKTLPEKQRVFMITTKSGKKIKCSGKHRFPLASGEEKPCFALKAGDILLSKNICVADI
jgi:intein/homing endonuclease